MISLHIHNECSTANIKHEGRFRSQSTSYSEGHHHEILALVRSIILGGWLGRRPHLGRRLNASIIVQWTMERIVNASLHVLSFHLVLAYGYDQRRLLYQYSDPVRTYEGTARK